MVEVGGSNPPGPTKIFNSLLLLDLLCFSEPCVLAAFLCVVRYRAQVACDWLRYLTEAAKRAIKVSADIFASV